MPIFISILNPNLYVMQHICVILSLIYLEIPKLCIKFAFRI